jgi:uncharacterized protein (DUF736 family)
MIIGNFRHDWKRGIYIGEIKTLALHREHVQFRSVNKSHENEPDYRIIEEGLLGESELGAAWKRQDTEGKDYLSVRLTDPILGIEIDARLIFTGEDRAELWCSPGKRKAKAE